MYPKKAFPYLGLALLATGSALHADPLVLTPTEPPAAPTTTFSPPVYNPGMPPITPPMTYPGNHSNAVLFSMPESVTGTFITSSFTWEYLSDGVYTVSSSPDYTTAYLSFSLSYSGAVRKDSEQTTAFSTPTLEFIGLEGITMGELNVFTVAGNAGFQFMYSATVTLSADAAFSFTGFRLTSTIESGEHEVDFGSLISASMSFTGSTMSETDPGGGLTYQAAVPEPSSLLLLAAAGVGGCAWRHRSRVKARALKR